MAVNKLMAIVVIGILVGMGLGYITSQIIAPKATTAPSNIILNTADEEHGPSNESDEAGIVVLNPEGKLEGRVIMIEKYIENETDRYHFLVVPDTQYVSLLSDGNKQKLEGAMMVEVDKDDSAIMPRLHVLQHLEIHGPYVTDTENNWNEIHPAEYIKAI